MIVPVAHPAPVAFVPPRARKERFAHAAMTTPVELVEESLSRSVDVGPLFPAEAGVMAEPLRLLDGRLWCPVAARPGAGPFREAALDEFTAWLSGGGDDGLRKFFQRQFSGTPLVAIGRDERANAMVMSRGLETRGEPLDLDAVREVRLDGRERARDELARYLAEEIRVLDGRPYMRSAPLMQVNGVTGTLSLKIRSSAWSDHPGMRTFPATPDTMEAVVAVQQGLGVRPSEDRHQEAERQRWAALVPAGTLDGDDVRFVLDAFAEPMRRSLDEAIALAGPRSRERLEAARRAMSGVEIAAMTGTAHRDGMAPVLALREALAAWKAGPQQGSHGQEFLAAFLDRVLIPRMEAQAEADLEAAGLLAP